MLKENNELSFQIKIKNLLNIVFKIYRFLDISLCVFDVKLEF